MDSLAANVARRFIAAQEAAEEPKKPPTYTGVFLDEASHRALLAWWEKHTDTPLHGKIWAHHMTIKFKPTAEDLEKTPIGKKVHLKVIGWAADEKGQAVLVEPEGIASANHHPHITISTAPGTGPVYSNDLLAKGSNRVSGPTLTGVVDAR
jgi:Fungal tRNA ligase phosphodiesterase domain